MARRFNRPVMLGEAGFTASAEAAVAAAVQGGGTVVSPLFETPYGRMAGITDPAGAVFFVNENTGQPQPDR